MAWYDDINAWDDSTWVFLKGELDKLTSDRFTPFFCKQVLCCDVLYKEWKPWIAKNLQFLSENHDTIFGGSILSRNGQSGMVGGISYTQSNTHGIISNRTRENNPLINIALMNLCEKYGLFYAAPRIAADWFACGSCGSCTADECERCGGDEC